MVTYNREEIYPEVWEQTALKFPRDRARSPSLNFR